ncbi:MAG: hypothetical protein ACI8W8_002671 [Rhodothermales bacterium]|jgi:hypothetical protein
MLALHTMWMAVVLLLLIASAGRNTVGALAGHSWGKSAKLLTLFAAIAVDFQALLGIGLWMAKRHWTTIHPVRSWEHPVTMILVLVLVHVAVILGKKERDPVDDKARFRSVSIASVLAAGLAILGVARILATRVAS